MSYKLKGNWNTKQVWLNDKLLSPVKSQTVQNHSPDGFAWGYMGSGPSQLALAFLLETSTTESATSNYQEYKRVVISPLPQADFEVILLEWKRL